jgi:hypothetical protein
MGPRTELRCNTLSTQAFIPAVLGVFNSIANYDHARFIAISSRVFFINTEENTLAHIYDDRGWA